MVSFGQLVSLQTTVVLLLAAGFLLKKMKIIKKQDEKCLSDLVMLVFMPCSIVYSFSTDLTIDVLMKGLSILVIGFAVQFLAILVNKFVYNWYPKKERCIYQYGTLVSNGGLVGIPIINGLFGNMGVVYANIYLIAQRIFIWSAGLSLFTDQKGDLKSAVKRTVTNPTVIAIVLGLLPSLFHTVYPAQVLEALHYIGNCLSAASLMVVGALLADVEWKGLFSKGMLQVTANRLLVMPLLVLFGCRLLGVDEQITWIAVLLIGMPVASTCAVLARKYDQDYILASKTILVSTILSVFTLPVLTLF